MWQIGLINTGNEALYKKVRMFKTVTFFGALTLGAYEYVRLGKQWQHAERFYPEATQLQSTLRTEAMIAREHRPRIPTVEERMLELENPATREKYSQFYQIKPQRHMDGDKDINAPMD